MEIQKVFSDGEERIYSVLMTEEEVMLFSTKSKNKAEKEYMEEVDRFHKKKGKIASAVLSGYGGVIGGLGGSSLGKSTKGMIGKGAVGSAVGALIGYGAAKGLQAYDKNYAKRFLKNSDAETIDAARKLLRARSDAPII